MAYNDNRNRSFGRRDFGGPRAPRQMSKTVCSDCGKDCEVPFVPSGNKPVYCSMCFDKYKGSSTNTGRYEDTRIKKPQFEDRSFKPPQNNDQLNIICNKLDKILAILSSNVSKKAETTPTQKLEKPVEVVKKKKKISKKEVLPQETVKI